MNMIRNYIIERRSWIIIFILIQILLLFIAYLDPSISFKSFLYMYFLSHLLFITFILIRYHKEIAFYKSLDEIPNMYDVTNIEKASQPFAKIIKNYISEQNKQYQTEISKYQMTSEQEQDELLSWIHEVKTPLTTLQLMIDRIDDEELKAEMMVEWLRIELLLDQQLHQKRISFIENDLHIKKVALQPIIHKEIKSLRSWCLKKGIGFDLKLEHTEVLSDEKWLGFILRQILTNAVKYSSKSDITIKSYARENKTKLEIKDEGRGISSKDLPRIFDKGFTSTTKIRDQSATGMGLYLAKQVATPLLIKIKVHSIFQQGTTVTLTFPEKNEFLHITSM